VCDISRQPLHLSEEQAVLDNIRRGDATSPFKVDPVRMNVRPWEQ